MKSLSVIVPLYNEKNSLEQLYQEICAELARIPGQHELIFVDDGSRDGSFEILRGLQARDPRIRLIRFRRNFGKSAALSAGFSMVRGDLIVTLDADLQDQPFEIHRLLEKLEEGNDLVSGWKQDRKDPLGKRWASRVFNTVTALLTGVPLHDINCGLKAYRRQVIEEIRVYGEMHRFIPVLASYRGFRVAEIPVSHRARLHGQSKFGVERFLGGFFDLLTVIMLTRYTSKPLHVFGILGVSLLGLGFLLESYLTVGWFLGYWWIQERPLFLLGILLLIIGVQFIFFGLLAEMLAYSTRRADDYSIQEILETRASSRPEADLQAVRTPPR